MKMLIIIELFSRCFFHIKFCGSDGDQPSYYSKFQIARKSIQRQGPNYNLLEVPSLSSPKKDKNMPLIYFQITDILKLISISISIFLNYILNHSRSRVNEASQLLHNDRSLSFHASVCPSVYTSQNFIHRNLKFRMKVSLQSYIFLAEKNNFFYPKWAKTAPIYSL